MVASYSICSRASHNEPKTWILFKNRLLHYHTKYSRWRGFSYHIKNEMAKLFDFQVCIFSWQNSIGLIQKIDIFGTICLFLSQKKFLNLKKDLTNCAECHAQVGTPPFQMQMFTLYWRPSKIMLALVQGINQYSLLYGWH